MGKNKDTAAKYENVLRVTKNRATPAAREEEANRLLQTSFMSSVLLPGNDDDPDPSDDELEEESQQDGRDPLLAEIEDKLHSIMCGLDSTNGIIFDKDFWLKKTNGLNIENMKHDTIDESYSYSFEEDTDRCKKEVREVGYSVTNPVDGITSLPLEEIIRVMYKLKEEGWPPVFVFVFDEVWQLIAAAWDKMEGVIGEECILEPSMFAHALNIPDKRIEKSVGNNFGIPHRDNSHKDCFFEDGEPNMISLWLPLRDVSLDNGCMFVVPKEFDDLFEESSHPHHLKAAIPTDDGSQKIRFDVGAARALPGKGGACYFWNGNLIHWGGKCSSKAKEPRISLTCALRAARAPVTHLQGEMLAIQKHELLRLNLKQRLQYIAHSVLLFSWWYDKNKPMVPKELLLIERA